MPETNHANYRIARDLIATGVWWVVPEAGLVGGIRGRAFSTRGAHGYVRGKFRHPETKQLHFVLLHRVVWEYVNGPIEGALQVNHINGVKDDNRIANLELVTASENILHAHATGLAKPRYLTDNNSPLSLDDVLQVYRLAHAGVRQADICQMFGTNQATVSNIKCGRRFGWATGHKQPA